MSGQAYEQLTLFPADSPASHSPWLESKRAKGMIDTSGRRCSELSPSCARVALSVKTFLDLFELRLRESFPNCKASATKQGLTVLRLGMSAHCTRERESLSWPRPTTGAPLCGGTHNFRQMVALRDAGVVTEEERKNLTCGSGGKSNPRPYGVAHGIPNRVDRLKCLGNAVVPQQAYPIFRALRETILDGMKEDTL